MNEQNNKKPSSLVFIGWFLIIVSIFLIFSNLFGFMMRHFGGLDPASLKEAQLFPEPINFLIEVFLFVYNIVLLISSIQFLRLKAWALTSLEVLTWINIAYSLIFVIWALLPIDNKFMSHLYSTLSSQVGETVLLIFKILFYFTYAICLTVATIIVFKLRSATIRNAFVSKSNSDSLNQVI